MFKIFKEFSSHLETYAGDPSAFFLNLAGGLLIGISFFVVGVICIISTNRYPRTQVRKRLLTLFGLFLISCSFSRFLSILCMWHNYAILDGWVKILTGILATFAIVYAPRAIKEASTEKHLENAQEMLRKTQEELNELRQLSEKTS